MRAYPSVSIIFPNHNGGTQPLECLSSIRALSYPKNKIEIIVIDNNSSDGSLQKIKDQPLGFAQSKKLKIIENKENVGFGKAINQGIKSSSGEYVFIGNDDIVFDKDSLTHLINYAQKNPDVAILGGKIFAKNKPTKVVSCGYMMNKWTGNVYPSPQSHKIHEPDWVQGCAMLVPRKVLHRIGILDEGFSLIYFEDYDFCLRARRAGYKVVYLPSALFWHGVTMTMNKNKPHKYYQWYKNKIRFFLKNLSLLNLLSVLLIQIFFVTPYRLIVLRDGRFFPFLKGMYWNINHIKDTLSKRRKT